MYRWRYLTPENVNLLLTQSRLAGIDRPRLGVVAAWRRAQDFKNPKTGVIYHHNANIFLRRKNDIFDIDVYAKRGFRIRHNARADFANYGPMTERSNQLVNDVFRTVREEAGVSGTEKVRKLPKNSINHQGLHELLMLVGVSNAKVPGAQADVLAAAAAPALYFEGHYESDFAERGITKPRRDLYRFVLLNRLEKYGVVAAVDWKAGVDDVVCAVAKLLKRRQVVIKDKPKPPAKMSTLAALETLAAAIDEKSAWSLRDLHFEMDAYNVVLLPKKDLSRAKRLFGSVKIPLRPVH
jgi:hypothetical protein